MKPIPLPTLRAPPALSLAACLAAAFLSAQTARGEEARPRNLTPADMTLEAEVARYCGNLAPTASEARASYQARQLAELEERVRKSTEELEQRAGEARAWVVRRDAMMKAATDDVIAVYAKMSAEAAAPQLAAMEDAMAAAVLVKLNPRAASAILSEMEAERAAKLAALMAGAGADKS